MRIPYLLLCLLLTLASSCTRFYRLRENLPKTNFVAASNEAWTNLDQGNIILVHQSNETFELSDVVFHDSTQEISGRIQRNVSKPMYYYNKVANKSNRISKRNRGDKISEVKQVHLYMTNSTVEENGICRLKLKEIAKVDVTGQAHGRNALATLPILAPAAFVGYIVIACGCPHVYIDNGQQFTYEKSLFSGAIASQLERSDLKQIPDYFPEQSMLTLTLNNEEEEDQYLDQVSLKVVEHSSVAALAVDPTGKVVAYKSAVSPRRIVDEDERNVLSKVMAQDQETYDFKADKMSDLCRLDATFSPSEIQGKSHVILRLKNTQWAGYLYHEFSKLFGANHGKWVEQNKDKSKEDREAWMRQEGIKLRLEVKKNGGWEALAEVDLIGDVAFENVAIPITTVPTEGLELRLLSGFHFWEVDYLALAEQDENLILGNHILTPTVVNDADGDSQIEKLTNSDNRYLVSTPATGPTTIVFEKIPIPASHKRSLFLQAEGYFLNREVFTGKTHYKRLAKFKTPGELSRFSKELYSELQKKNALQ